MNHYDCIVAGFGTAGSVAAIAAGRLGASVLVLESGTAPGGTHTVGGVGCYYFQQPVPGSLMAELDAACRHLISQSCWSTSLSETKKHVIEEKAAEAGVEVRYEAVISACRVESGILREIRWSAISRERAFPMGAPRTVCFSRSATPCCKSTGWMSACATSTPGGSTSIANLPSPA